MKNVFNISNYIVKIIYIKYAESYELGLSIEKLIENYIYVCVYIYI